MPFLPTRGNGGGGTVDTDEILAGNLGATYTLNMASYGTLVQLEGVLNANCTLTLTNVSAGDHIVLLLTQDATGGRTLTVDYGASSQAVTVDSTASSVSVIEINSPDGTDVYISGGATTSGGVAVDFGRAGLLAPSGVPYTTSVQAGAANTLRAARIWTPRAMTVVGLNIVVTTASATDDAGEASIYSAAGSRLATSGSVTGILNSTGTKTLPISASLDADTVYYIAFGYGASAAPGTLMSVTFAQTQLNTIFGTGLPHILMFSQATAFPAPSTATPTNTTAVPAMALVE